MNLQPHLVMLPQRVNQERPALAAISEAPGPDLALRQGSCVAMILQRGSLSDFHSQEQLPESMADEQKCPQEQGGGQSGKAR